MTGSVRNGLLDYVRWLRSRIFERQAYNVTAELHRLAQRVETLELLLTEHPGVSDFDLVGSAFASPAVSVIMPTWNRADIVGAAIRSVQAQSFPDWELLVMDDGSTDDTAAVLASFASDPRIKAHVLPHAGQCVARNHGQSVARGALIAYLDSDNLWYPGFLGAAVAVFAARPDVDCAYGAMVSDVHRPRVIFEAFDRERLLAGNFIDMSCFVHRAQLIAQLGGFDAKTTPLDDWDLVLRYTAHAPAYRIPVAAVRYREMDDKRISMTQSKQAPDARIRAKWGA